jgi:hypothetical protein
MKFSVTAPPMAIPKGIETPNIEASIPASDVDEPR